jgi:hypothetical protein
MFQEDEVTTFEPFSEGKRMVAIEKAEVHRSQARNEMLVIQLRDAQTQRVNVFGLTMLQGKRWSLQRLLESNKRYSQTPEGYSVFHEDKLIGCTVIVEIKNTQEEFVGRDMKSRQVTRFDVVRFYQTQIPF